MPQPKGYRVARLRRRRRSVAERRQAWVLYVLAAVVAFAAVMGAWYVASHWLRHPAEPTRDSYLVLITLTATPGGKPVGSALAVRDAATGAVALYVIPDELLLDGPKGEYVFASDAAAAGTLKQDLQRVVNASVDAVYTVPLTRLTQLAGGGEFQLSLPDPVTLTVAGTEHTFQDGALVSAADVPALFAAGGQTGWDALRMQEALWSAMLQAAALQPADKRAAVLASAAPTPAAGADTWYLQDALKRLTQGDASVASFPADSRVAEGQFAFVPRADDVMAQITRKAPGFSSPYTVLVRNGSGRLGIGKAVADRLAALDVNLPAPANADSFDHRQTEILAGAKALPVAEDIRAILGRGVVLDGPTLPANTVLVVVGSDMKLKELESKDQP